MNDTPTNEPTSPIEKIAATAKPQPTQVVLTTDKIDEIAAYISSARMPESYSMDAPFHVVPKCMGVIDVERFMPAPSKVRKSIDFTDQQSFLQYFTEFSQGCSPQLFTLTDKSGLKILCVFDFDQAGKHPNGGTMPQWGMHVAQLSMKYHPDYAELRAIADKWFYQLEFSSWLEENLHIFVKPAGAEMLEMAQHLKGMRKVNFQSGTRLSNGEIAIEYVEEVKAVSHKGELIIPEYLEINTPLFEGYEAKNIKAAFHWRISDDKGEQDGNSVKFMVSLLTKLDERKAQEDVKLSISEATGKKLLSVSKFDNIVYR